MVKKVISWYNILFKMMAIASSYPRGNYPDDVYLETVVSKTGGCMAITIHWTGLLELEYSTGLLD